MNSTNTTAPKGQDLTGALDADKLVIEKASDGKPAWCVGDVTNHKQYEDARVTLKFAISSIEDQIIANIDPKPEWQSKVRKALRLKTLALEVLDRRFGGDKVDTAETEETTNG